MEIGASGNLHMFNCAECKRRTWSFGKDGDKDPYTEKIMDGTLDAIVCPGCGLEKVFHANDPSDGGWEENWTCPSCGMDFILDIMPEYNVTYSIEYREVT
jgi:DNA-directed RNA polymerase subunit RPC12/RpoP